MLPRRTLVVIAASLAAGAFAAAEKAARTEPIPYAEARPILEAHGRTVSETDWPAWVARRNAEIRARLSQGDEDSVVNLWLYGTRFTKLPRATDRKLAGMPKQAIEDLLVARLDDFVGALAKPGTNERLQFSRDLLARHGADVSTAAGRDKAEEILVAMRERAIAEHQRYAREAASPSAYATLFSDRGLSTDTRLTASFAIDKALAAVAQAGSIARNGVSRAAIVGPGLDFTDKAEGYDFYPLQTIQPFAVVDSLARLTLASPARLQITTLDLSPRVNGHLDAARRRAAAGTSYVIQVPLGTDQPSHAWQPDLVAYWQRFGENIGRTVPAAPPPEIARDVRVRAIAVRPAIVAAMASEDVNIILERLAPLPDDQRFDLIVATNILVYYDAFEQALALANISRMLKPGGLFLTNYAVAASPSMEPLPAQTTTVYFDKQRNGDTIYCYRRR